MRRGRAGSPGSETECRSPAENRVYPCASTATDRSSAKAGKESSAVRGKAEGGAGDTMMMQTDRPADCVRTRSAVRRPGVQSIHPYGCGGSALPETVVRLVLES